MRKKYLYWNKDVKIIRYSALRSFLVIDDTDYMINSSGMDIIVSIDGTQTLEDVINYLMAKYDDTYENISGAVKEYIETLENEYGLKLCESVKPLKNKCVVVDKQTVYPKVASIEITERCNVKCLHCYGEHSMSLTCDMSLSQIKQLLVDLKAIDVEVIEITGGDCSVHPELISIIKYALSLKFQQIDILTNGVHLTKELKDLIKANQGKITVQIDLHSLDNDYLKWFMQTTVNVDVIKGNIMELATAGIQMRVATVFTERNLKEFWDIARFVDNCGVIWGITPVEPLGRADYSVAQPDIFLSAEGAKFLHESIMEIKKVYPNLLFEIKEENRSNENNCGVLSGHVVINVHGDIKLCTMDNLHYCNTSIGNVFNTNIKTIFDLNKDLIMALAFQKTVELDQEECQGCEYIYSCAKCMLRTLINVQKKGFTCNWYKKCLSNTLKEFCFPEIKSDVG